MRTIIALGFLFLVSFAFAQPDAQFAKANQDYAQGSFKEAIAGYEALVQSREWSANLFYNLGNAYFRTQDFGRAILNYERALAIDRHHPETDANLRIVQDEARALELQPGWLDRYLQMASLTQYSVAAAIAFWVAVFSIVVGRFAQRRAVKTKALSIFAFTFFAAAIFAIYKIDNVREGAAIVTGNDVQARLATADSAGSVLALPPGSEIRVLSTRGDWIYADLPNNLRGWIPGKDAELVRL